MKKNFYTAGEIAKNLQLNDMKFDVIIANHMLYHLERIQDCLFNLKKALKKDGYLELCVFFPW